MTQAIVLLIIFMLILTISIKPIGLYILPICKGEAPSLFKYFDNFLIKKLHLLNKSYTWKEYAISLILFNMLGIIFVYLIQRIQAYLPLNVESLPNVESFSALNTAISFATNTNWQGYGGESTMSYLVQMTGLCVQNFVSAATGIATAFVLMRSFVLKESKFIGNFFADLIRISLYILLPICFIYAIFLVSQGVIQNFNEYVHASTLTGDSQIIAMGPAASQEAIKLIGTNGGGFFNVNSAHPFENTTAISNFSQCLAIFLISSALCYTFGSMINDIRQGLTIYAAMAILFIIAATAIIYFENMQSPALLANGADPSFFNLEGKEMRFDLGHSSLFSAVTTAASCGAVNNMHDSLNPISGLITTLLIQLGEIIFGGVGSGFYGIFIFILLTVFITGLMVGRTPEYLGKKITVKQIKLVTIAMLTTPILVLIFTAITCFLDFNMQSLNNAGAHGFSEYLYAFSSAANNNGSAFAGLSANTTYFNITLGLCMFLGRFVIIICILALAGSIAHQKIIPASQGTLPTHGGLFCFMIIFSILLIGALTYLPALSLGGLVEHLQVFY